MRCEHGHVNDTIFIDEMKLLSYKALRLMSTEKRLGLRFETTIKSSPFNQIKLLKTLENSFIAQSVSLYTKTSFFRQI